MAIRNALNFEYRKRLPRGFGGGAMYVNPRSDWRVLRPGWNAAAPDLYEVAKRFVDSGDVVWDIGSNLGIFAAFCSARVGRTGYTYSVEPAPYYCSLIMRSADRFPSEFSPVEVLCAAVADKVGTARFSIPQRGHARSSLADVRSDYEDRQITVPTVTLDSLGEVWKKPDFIKIDVEGAESLVLRGAGGILSTARPKIYIEVSEECVEEVDVILKDYDYDLFKLSLSGNDRPIDKPDFYTIAVPR